MKLGPRNLPIRDPRVDFTSHPRQSSPHLHQRQTSRHTRIFFRISLPLPTRHQRQHWNLLCRRNFDFVPSFVINIGAWSNNMSMPGHPASRKQREAQAKSAAEGDSRQFSLQNFPQNTAAQSTAAQSTAELAKLAVEPPQSGPKSEPRPIPTKGPVTFERKYDRDLKEVEVLYNNGDWDGAIKAAKSNLSDPSLPRRHIIKDHLIRAHAAEFYAETEEYVIYAPSLPHHPLTFLVLDTASLRRRFTPKPVC